MSRLIDLTGKKFGRLTVIERADNKGKFTMWLCKCECGKVKVVLSSHLRSGHSTSCGCFSREVVAKIGMKNRKFEVRGRLYGIWTGIKSRCLNPNRKDFPLYGGRGITVCDEWKDDFGAFRDWAMTNGYKETLTLDRIDVNGNYEPSNCRWATIKEQSNNRRNNHLITCNEVTHTISEWANITGLSRTTIRNRLYIKKISPDKALNTNL